MKISGSGQSHDAAPLYYSGKPLHLTSTAALYLTVPAVWIATVILPLAGIVYALKQWPLATVIMLIVGYFSGAIWVRHKLQRPETQTRYTALNEVAREHPRDEK